MARTYRNNDGNGDTRKQRKKHNQERKQRKHKKWPVEESA